ncbi:DMT family transporter [Bacillus sp. UNC438CL73TsuS30]|uniref:DMT family transporter n=1 Tax=Bacillus sp. UNC438CL73TsuS30 TaxID=1340434 RepID=UPI0009E024CA|nr:EamA family transporter [Bacillus sp. UNC438CL73TsuS30]
MSSRKNVILADLSLLGIAIAWGYVFVLTKDLLDETSPLFLNAGRFLFSVIILWFFKGKSVKKAGWHVWKKGLLCGIPLWLGFTSQTIGIESTTPGKAGVLTGTVVIIVPFLYFVFLKASVQKGVIIGSIFTFFGLAILSWDGGSMRVNTGDLLVLLCAVFFAVHFLAVDWVYKQSNSFDDLVFIMIQLLVAGVMSIPFAFWFEPLPSSLSSHGWFAFGFDTLIGTLLAYIVQMKAQQYSPPTHVSLLLSLESFFAFLFSWLLWGEVLTRNILIGVSFILLGVFMTEFLNIVRPIRESPLVSDST